VGRAVSETTIDRSADEVWATIRDFGFLDWYPHVATCVVDGNVRKVTTEGIDLETHEDLVHHDDQARTYSYGIVRYVGPTSFVTRRGATVDVAPTVGHTRATIVVEPVADDRCAVRYELELDDGFDELLTSMSANYQLALEHLKAYVTR